MSMYVYVKYETKDLGRVWALKQAWSEGGFSLFKFVQYLGISSNNIDSWGCEMF